MQREETVFERHYKHYLQQLEQVNFEHVAPKLGAKADGSVISIPLFNREYRISTEKIIGPSGEIPSYDVCVILCKYLLLCPNGFPADKDWVSFRDLKNSGPLTSYFANDVERAIALHFSGKIDQLKNAGSIIGGYAPALDVAYDVTMQFDALPMIPVIMLYNDADEEFPATCSVLFESRIEKYLDAECIAILGRQLFDLLKNASERFE